MMMIRTEIVVKHFIFVLEPYDCKVAVARSGEIKRKWKIKGHKARLCTQRHLRSVIHPKGCIQT